MTLCGATRKFRDEEFFCQEEAGHEPGKYHKATRVYGKGNGRIVLTISWQPMYGKLKNKKTIEQKEVTSLTW